MLTPHVSKAEICSKPIQTLNAQEVSPCSGYLISKDLEFFVRTDREVNIKVANNLKLQLTTKTEILTNQEAQIKALSDMNGTLQQELEASRRSRYFWTAGGVVAGVLLTTLALSAAK